MQLLTWIEDLIWCPSQCYYYFEDPKEKQCYCIYLRWRHEDPWTAQLVKTDEEGNFNYEEEWKNIKLSRSFKDNEYKDLEKSCIEFLRSRFPFVLFPDGETEEKGE